MLGRPRCYVVAVQCGWCGALQVRGRYLLRGLPLARWTLRIGRLEFGLSHGICPTCYVGLLRQHHPIRGDEDDENRQCRFTAYAIP